MAWDDVRPRLFATVEGSGPPLVLLHGLTLDARVWEPQVSALAARYRVVRYDQRGFGQSADPIDRNYADRDDLRDVLDEHGIERADLVGLSRGGRIALDFALHSPERVSKIVLIGTPLRIDEATRQEEGTRQKARVRELLSPTNPDRDQNVLKAARVWLSARHWATPAGRPHHLVREIVTDYFRRRHTWEATPRTADLTEEALRRMSAPIFALCGEGDLSAALASIPVLHRLLPQCESRIVPTACHISNIDNPRAVNDALLTFLT